MVALQVEQEDYEEPVGVQLGVLLVALDAPEVELVVALHVGREE